MLFHSPEFLLFLAAFLCLLPFTRGGGRMAYVTLASYVFYAWWYPPYIFLLFGLSLYAYALGRILPKPRAIFGLIVAGALLPLLFFKYTHFLAANVALLIGMSPPDIPYWQLPLGISFITFTIIAYLADVQAARAERQKNPVQFFLFVSFFPHLIAGPILRVRELAPQVAHLKFQPSMIKLALLLFAIGAVKKVGVADQIAPVIDRIYASPVVTQPEAFLALYGFSAQIYGDFSGYTDMALALAYLINVRLPRNFNRPYAAGSIRGFWRSWHMTLSRWLRDYLYIPLGGSRHGPAVAVMAALVTMFLGGLWHGAAWTFAIWGVIHGLMVGGELMARHVGLKLGLPRWLKILITFHVVSVAWVFFRAGSMEQAMTVFKGFLTPGDWLSVLTAAHWQVAIIAAMFLAHRYDTVSRVRWLAARATAAVIIPFSMMLIVIIAVIGMGNPSAFIYFDF